MNLNTLRFRLIWMHSVVIALVVVCIGLIRYQLNSYGTEQRFDKTLFSDAHSFVSRFHYDRAGFTLSTDGLSTGSALAIQELEHYFIVTDLQGHVLREDLHNRLIRTMLYSGQLNTILHQQDGFAKATAEDGSTYRFISLSMPPRVFPEPAIMHIGRSMEVQKGILRGYLIFYLYSVPSDPSDLGCGGVVSGRKGIETFRRDHSHCGENHLRKPEYADLHETKRGGNPKAGAGIQCDGQTPG